jgi:hypothetical protein
MSLGGGTDIVDGILAYAVLFHEVGGRGSGIGAGAGANAAVWGGRGSERQRLRHKPPIVTLDLSVTALAWRRSRHWGIGAARHKVRETQSVRKDWILGFNRWSGAGLGGSSILPPHHWMRGNNLLGRILWSGCVGAAVAAPLTARLVREKVAAHPARPHGCAAKQTHAHAVVCIKAALAAVATIGETTRLDVGAHLDNLEALAPVLGRRAAAVKAGACRKGAMTSLGRSSSTGDSEPRWVTTFRQTQESAMTGMRSELATLMNQMTQLAQSQVQLQQQFQRQLLPSQPPLAPMPCAVPQAPYMPFPGMPFMSHIPVPHPHAYHAPDELQRESAAPNPSSTSHRVNFADMVGVDSPSMMHTARPRSGMRGAPDLAPEDIGNVHKFNEFLKQYSQYAATARD